MSVISYYPFPVLERLESGKERLAARAPYLRSAGYYYSKAEFDGNGPDATILISHHLGGSNLVVDLLEQGHASFAITVSAPDTMIRRIIVEGRALSRSSDGEFGSQQQVKLSKVEYTGTVFVRGSVLVTQNVAVTVDSKHGLLPELLGSSFELPRGTVIATEGMHAFGIGTLSALLRLRKDTKLKEGQLSVAMDESNGFRFLVRVGPRLFGQVIRANGPAEKAHANSVCTHALSRGLDLLRDDPRKDDWWQSYPSLRWLEREITKRGLPTWEQDGFRAEIVATALRDHNIFRATEQE